MSSDQQVIRPSQIPGLKLWLETDTASYPTSVVFPSNVCANGDFEGAAGPPLASWTTVRGTISRESGTRTGGTGSYVGRIAHDGVNSSGVITQTALAVGNTYRLTGYARASASGGVPAMADGVNFIWTGSTSTDWQAFDVTFVAAGTAISLYGSSLAAGKYVEFDDVSVMPIHVSQITDLSGTALHIQRSTASLQPTWVASGLGGVARFDGSSDYMISPDAASSWRWLHMAAGSTVIALLKIASAASGDCHLFDTCNKTASNTGIMLAYDAANARFEYRVAMANAAWHFNCNAAATKDAWHIVTATFSDAEGYLLQVDDGVASAGAVTGTAVDYNPSYTAYLGSRAGATNYFNGDLAALLAYSERINPMQIAKAKRYLRRKAAMLGLVVG